MSNFLAKSPLNFKTKQTFYIFVCTVRTSYSILIWLQLYRSYCRTNTYLFTVFHLFLYIKNINRRRKYCGGSLGNQVDFLVGWRPLWRDWFKIPSVSDTCTVGLEFVAGPPPSPLPQTNLHGSLLGWSDFWKKEKKQHSQVVPNCYRTPIPKIFFEMMLLSWAQCLINFYITLKWAKIHFGGPYKS